MPYFFANDNIHYSRWLTIHLHDMITLSDCHPDVYEEFQRGHFALHKSQRAFSGMALDQVHEQNNAVVKSDGGAIGITENPSALLRWMTAGPEVCQLVTDYEEKSKGQDKEQILHHEDIPSAQKRFHNEVLNLSASIEELGNPFLEESGEFLTLDSKIISRSQNLYSFKAKGDDQFRSFRTCQHNFYDPIKKNKILLVENATTQQTHTHTLKEKNVKQDRALFANLFIVCQSRQLDLNDFFKYENQQFPPVLSNHGEQYCTQKADLISAMEELVETEQDQPQADQLLVDGSALVYSVRPTKDTFQEYAEVNFCQKSTVLPRSMFGLM